MATYFLLALLANVQQLGSPVWADREEATLHLRYAPPAFLRWAQKSSDAEVAARCSSLYRVWAWEVSGKLKPAGWPRLPWIDSLSYSYPDRYQVVRAYLAQARCEPSDVSIGAPEWVGYHKATRLFLFDELMKGRTEAELLDLLAQMVENEKSWIKHHRTAWKFSPEILTLVGE